jgi:hypothetical protein
MVAIDLVARKSYSGERLPALSDDGALGVEELPHADP